ncbi:MAG: Trk system potassium transporter TrkA [Proteobacteria bacterium]|nr:Trk system potassium transporter TrkA [Pseudomonadota bacterium]MBU1611845.1 Trk system potassium transporter TrkA [Pseudomonadota bacterium]
MRIIIVGAGEVGYHIARRLAVENKDVVVVDNRAEALTRVSETLDVQTMQGSGSSPRVLTDAGVQQADILLAVTDSDEINLMACYFAKRLSPNIILLARARAAEYADHNELLTGEPMSISRLINPDQEVVNSILRLMSVPGAVEINEFADGRIRLIGVNLPDDSPLIGTQLINLRDITGDIGLVIAALVRDDKLIIPSGGDFIQTGDVVYFACEITDQDEILELFGIKKDPINSVLIVGGGNIGYSLARSLDNKYYHTRLIDSDPKRCAFLSEELNRPIVLHGDGTDQGLLEEENVGDLDMVIAVTGEEEMNILTCLLAKKMGARETIVRINNFAYMPLIRPIGIDHVVNPRLAAVNTILSYIRRGKVISAVAIKGEEAEVLECYAEEKSRLTGKRIMDVKFPKGALILCFSRGDEVVVPRGDTVIEPGDRLVILSTRKNITKVESALSITAEFF